MVDEEEYWSGDDFSEDIPVSFDPDDLPELDISTVDAEDTLDVSAQFIRICARIYEDDPLHGPVYQWLKSLPRTSRGNFRDISSHLAMALRYYVDALDRGADLRLGSVNSVEHYGDGRVFGGRMVTSQRAERTSVGQSYRRSMDISDALDAKSPVTDRPENNLVHRESSQSGPRVEEGVPEHMDRGAHSVSGPSDSSPSFGGAPEQKTGVPDDNSGASLVARLAKEREGWG